MGLIYPDLGWARISLTKWRHIDNNLSIFLKTAIIGFYFKTIFLALVSRYLLIYIPDF